MNESEKLLLIFNLIRRKKSLPDLTSLDSVLNLRDHLGFDSLDLAELTVRIEVQFGVDIFADGLVFTVEEILSKLNRAQ